MPGAIINGSPLEALKESQHTTVFFLQISLGSQSETNGFKV